MIEIMIFKAVAFALIAFVVHHVAVKRLKNKGNKK